jgi:ribosomal protein S18 acetylase RimI-like enzyme
MTITAYTPVYWEDIQKVHDPARMQELTLAGLEAAFLPLTIAAEREALFDYRLYVALEEETAVGFVAFTEDELAWLYVRPDHQRRGIGRALAQFALVHMEGEEKSIEVLFGNEPARSLYRSLGFTKETIVHGKLPGNESFPVTVWQLTIPE